MAEYIALSYWDIAIAASLLCLNAGLSIYYKLGTEKRLFIAATRMVVQLTLVGLVLKALFATMSPWLTLLVGLLMIGFAGREAIAELIAVDAPMRAAILAGADADRIAGLAREAGSDAIRRDGLRKAAAGLTSIDEVLRAVGDA